MLKGEKCSDLAACSCRTKAESMARSLNSRMWPGTWGTDRRALDKMPDHHLPEDEEFFEVSPPSPVEDEERVRGVDSSAATVAGRAKLYELLQQHAADDATDVFYDVSENAGPSDFPREKKEGISNINCLPEKLISDMKRANISVHDLGVNNVTVNGSFEDHSERFLNGESVVSVTKISNIANNTTDKSMEKNASHNSSRDSKNESVSAAELSTKNIITDDSLVNSSSDVLGTANQNANEIIESNKTVCDKDNCYDTNRDDSAVNSDLKSSVENLNSFDCGHISTAEDCNKVKDSEISLHCDFDPASASPIKITEEKASPTKPDIPLISDDQDNFKDSPRLKTFDESRPMISRSTSLKTGKTPPGTPKKKIVRFADALGLDLEDVRTICGDIPTIPQSAYSDLKLDKEDQPLPPTSTIEIRDRQQGSWENIRTAIGPNTLYPMFPIPGQQIGFWDRVQSQGVCLESVNVSDSSVQCTCRVMNWGFHKKVGVRYSSNNWLTSSDIDASYVSGSSQNNTDSFTFNIFLPNSCRNVEFALRYEINGKEYWDNNNGVNYRFSCHSISSSIQGGPSSPTFVHQFW